MAVRRCLPVRLTRRGTIAKPTRPEKERIARKVAEQIPDGSTPFIDIGTTPEAVAHALLNHSNLRIVTNNLNVANTLMVKEDFRMILAGGELRSRDGGSSAKRRSILSPSSALISAFWDKAASIATARCWSSITTSSHQARHYRELAPRYAGCRSLEIWP